MGVKKLNEFFPLSNSDIDKHMFAKVGKNYKGCYARNDIPKRLENGYYVINLDDKYNKGTHWVGMKVSKYEIIYFDSFGFICPNEVIYKKDNRVIWYSTHEIQSIKSVACGFYVIYFLSELHKGRDKLDILLDFDNKNSLSNDETLKNNLVTL